MTTGILAAIDGALEDWGTSEDAMRWQPDPARVICDGGKPMMPEPPVPAMVYLKLHTASDPQPSEAVAHTTLLDVDWTVTSTVDGYSATSSVAPDRWWQIESVMLWDAAEGGNEVVIAPGTLTIGHARRGSRCRTCNPAGNALPLAVDGREYRRRQRARRHRR